jgi:N-acetylmuramoyl-L-alanine amidase
VLRTSCRPAIPHCCCISAILFGVRNILGVVALAFGISALAPFVAAQSPDQQTTPQEAPPTAPAPPQPAPLPPNPAPTPVGPLIVLDPAHGGTDSGARGQNGAAEKDIVLRMARGVKAELERQGFRVMLTRNDDSNPSYDDRAAAANGYHDAIFVSLHVASTGTIGSVRAYYDQLSTPNASPQTDGLNLWNEAQRPYQNTSHHLADLIQIELTQRFPGSTDTSSAAAVRGLRSVTGPAVAIELSSVSAPDPNSLANSAIAPLSDAIARAVMASRAANPGGAKL